MLDRITGLVLLGIGFLALGALVIYAVYNIVQLMRM